MCSAYFILNLNSPQYLQKFKGNKNKTVKFGAPITFVGDVIGDSLGNCLV